MITIRRSHERGHADHGWLNSYHTFSFAGYHDPRHMGFRALRVINEDRVAPEQGFGEHPHRDMEIISYVLEGALEHKDSMGNGSILRPGEFQRMSAGTGVLHSEFNPSSSEPAHFYQIWLQPNRRGVRPSYDQRDYPLAEKHNRLRLVASNDGHHDSFTIQQNASVYLATLDKDVTVEHTLTANRHAWVQVMRGAVRIGEVELDTGDAAAISNETDVKITASKDAEIMLFDLE